MPNLQNVQNALQAQTEHRNAPGNWLRDFQNAQISGADPYRMAELQRQGQGLYDARMQEYMREMEKMRGSLMGGGGSVGKGGGGFRPDRSQQQGANAYLEMLMQQLLGGFGGMFGGGGGRGSGPMR